MSIPTPDGAVVHAGEAWLEEPLAAFELAWWGGAPPPIAEFLHSHLPAEQQQILAVELVKLDLHFRQATGSPGAARLLALERYLERLPALGSLAELPANLIAEEFVCRWKAGERSGVEEWVARFPRQGHALRELLPRVLANWQRESHVSPLAPILPAIPHGRFVLKRLLGSGGLALVYSAIDTNTQQSLAVKLLKKRFWLHSAARERLAAEAEILLSLAAPGVVPYRTHGELERGGPFVATELVLGHDLQRAFLAQRPTIGEVVLIARQLREILGAIHAQGVIHADLKPSNLILSDDGRLTLVDFGFAVRRDEATQAWPIPRGGTPAFIAPELRKGEASIDPRIDVYGYGAVVYWLVCGELPVANAVLPALPGLPEELRQFCQRCLAEDPRLRPAALDSAGDGFCC